MASLYPRLDTSGHSGMATNTRPTASGQSGRPRRNRPTSVEHLKELTKMLEASIQAGEVEKAKGFAEDLAKEKVKVNLDIDVETYETRQKEQSFSLKVIIEDRVSTGTTVYLTVKPSDTILDLKRRMMLTYDFPIEVQRWIISKRVCDNNKPLQHYQVKGQGCTAYLYMITAKSAHLDRETYNRNKEYALKGLPYPVEMSTGDYVTLNAPMMHTMPTNFHQNPTTGAAAGGGGTQNSNTRTPRNSGDLPLGPGQTSGEPLIEGGGGGESGGHLLRGHQAKQQQQVGWECLTCTLVNKPTRPGCEMCGAERPLDYKVPEGYMPSEEELRWIKETQETERLVLEEQAQTGEVAARSGEGGGAGGGGEEIPLTEEQLDLILRFNDAIQELAQKQGINLKTEEPADHNVPDSDNIPIVEDKK